jgi:hypothetical protein
MLALVLVDTEECLQSRGAGWLATVRHLLLGRILGLGRIFRLLLGRLGQLKAFKSRAGAAWLHRRHQFPADDGFVGVGSALSGQVVIEAKHRALVVVGAGSGRSSIGIEVPRPLQGRVSAGRPWSRWISGHEFAQHDALLKLFHAVLVGETVQQMALLAKATDYIVYTHIGYSFQ